MKNLSGELSLLVSVVNHLLLLLVHAGTLSDGILLKIKKE